MSGSLSVANHLFTAKSKKDYLLNLSKET